MREAYHAFFNAVVFLTRVPAPKKVRFEKADLDRAAWFFPLVGLLIGLVAALAYRLAVAVWPTPIGVGLSMLATLLLTGAFHEDGLADTCDGFGGGWNRDQIMTIMKDSRLGTFGAVGLMMALLLKWSCLSQLQPGQVMLILPVAHSVSRWAGVTVIRFGRQAPAHGQAKPKPGGAALPGFGYGLATLTVVLALLVFPVRLAVIFLVVSFIIAWLMYRYFARWIGGYTGDGLGAIQQVTELSMYLILLGFA